MRVAWLTLLAGASTACTQTDRPDAAIAMDLGFFDASVAPDLGFADAEAAADRGFAADVTEFDSGPGVSNCPPMGPFGVNRGDVLPDPALVDCDGNPYSLHGLCGKKAAWQFHLAGW